MKNVYLINLSFGLAGIERRFANLWRILRERRSVVPILVIPSALASILREANLLPTDPDGLVVIPEPWYSGWLGRLKLPPPFDSIIAVIRSRIAALGYRKVWRMIESDPGAVVHIGMNCSALRPPHVPTVYECVDAGLSQFETRHYRRASRRQCIVHCQTDRIRSALDSIYAPTRPRWRTVTNPTYFAHYDEPVECYRDPRLVVFAGRLTPEKNPLLFIEAVARARGRGCDCRAVMLGEGPLRRRCNDLVAELGLEALVSIDFVARPEAVLRSAAVYVSLQRGDNYGSQALLEAMGSGCAIIASDVGETAKVVTEEIGACVPLAVESVAGAIESMLQAPERTRQLGRRAEEVARTKYSADTYASFLERVYELAERFHRYGYDADDELGRVERATVLGKRRSTTNDL